MAIRSGARIRVRGRQAGAVLLLVLLLAPEAALAVWRGAGHGCACPHDSCPVRPAVQPEPPSCHDTGAHHAAPPVDPGPQRSLHAACPCGLPHSPIAPHREARALLEAAPAAFSLPPAGFLTHRPVSEPLSHLPVPESPPPRSAVPA